MSCIEHTLPRHGWIFNRHRILWRINSKLAGAQLWSAKKGVVIYCDSCNREWLATATAATGSGSQLLAFKNLARLTSWACISKEQQLPRCYDGSGLLVTCRLARLTSMIHGHASQKNNNCQDVTTAAGWFAWNPHCGFFEVSTSWERRYIHSWAPFNMSIVRTNSEPIQKCRSWRSLRC